MSVGKGVGGALVLVGILTLVIGFSMSPTQTITSETCYDDPMGFTGQECVEGEVTTPNPARGWATGGGVVVIIGGIILYLVSGNGSVETGKHYRPEESEQENEYSGVDTVSSTEKQDDTGNVYCAECGVENPPNSSFCHKCGSAITTGNEVTSHQKEEETLSEWTQTTSEQESQDTSEQERLEQEFENLKKIAGVTLIIIVTYLILHIL